MQKTKDISVVGLGKLGLCVTACLAKSGYKVTGVDIDSEKVEKINRGVSPIDETGLPELMRQAKKNITAISDIEKAVMNSSVTFIVVATPSLADGSFSNEYLEKALHKIAQALKRKHTYHLVVVTSTVMPHTLDSVARFLLEKISGKICGKDFGLAYNPEFIALGSVIHDFLNPDFILIGEMNKKDGEILEEIYNKTCHNNPRFARMSPVNAEIAKISLNCYVTTKITFANALASLCEKMKGADAHVITQALGMDSRIGTKYLKPGLGFGGPCFPRDNVAFAAFARRLELKAKLAEMVDEVNRDQVLRVVHRINHIAANYKKETQRITISVLGLSYKPNTPIIEDSQAISIVQLLTQEGYRVTVYDPQAMENARSVLGDSVTYGADTAVSVSRADIIVIAVPWDEFKSLTAKEINAKSMILDCWRVLKDDAKLNITYLGVGTQEKTVHTKGNDHEK